jgi:hypothetical protein
MNNKIYKSFKLFSECIYYLFEMPAINVLDAVCIISLFIIEL